jgi:hypothetical protein
MRSNLNTRQFFASGILQLMDALHQRIYRRFFFFGGFCIPGSAPKNFCATIKGCGVVFLRVRAFLADA